MSNMKKENTTFKNKEEFFRALKFLLFSLSAGIIQLVSSTVLKLILDYCINPQITFYFINQQDLSTFVADTVGLALSVIWNFTFNRKFTFKAATNVPLAMFLAFLFYVPFYPFQIWYVQMVETSLAWGFWGYLIGLVTCMIINFVLEFLWQRFFIFRKSLNTKPLAKTVEMHLDPKPFEQIKSGEKTVEMRCNDEKRKSLKPLDHIVFTNTKTGEKLKATVDKIVNFENFDELIKKYDRQKLGISENAKNPAKTVEKYYSAQDLKNGVVAIELKDIKHTK